MSTPFTSNLPIQRHPIDVEGKVLVNKEWYLALLGLFKQATSTATGPNVSDVQLLEAIDAENGSDGRMERMLARILVDLDSLLPQDGIERLASQVRQLEILIALMPDYQDPGLTPIDEKGSGGTPGFVAGVDFTAGTSTSLTLSRKYKSAAYLWVAFDGTWQGADQILSLVERVLTFTSAIPAGTSKVFVKGLA